MDTKVCSHLTTLVHYNQMARLWTFIIGVLIWGDQLTTFIHIAQFLYHYIWKHTSSNVPDPHIFQSSEKHWLMDIVLRVVGLLSSGNILNICNVQHDVNNFRFPKSRGVPKSLGKPLSVCQAWACWQSRWLHKRQEFHKLGPVWPSCPHLYHLYLVQGQ